MILLIWLNHIIIAVTMLKIFTVSVSFGKIDRANTELIIVG